ncbi:hypothetical protein Sru01_43110 [Sphaerisporangium rufum]|uniref:L,D-TPase catalytic domain-containing protein n=1 Tax=Sphaerisporangium rufum TaxID=1381558 RepID=A0A919R438_9ACTN|nr:L,D-transpeptidase [Sphaerisporangium rufum]GII79329.1 hypothetical protein Sru01_43110 [Sphaerisporangium rufum]
MFQRRPATRTLVIVAAAVAAAVAGLALLLYLINRKVDRELTPRTPVARPEVPVPVGRKQLAALPRATTWTTVGKAGRDPAPLAATDGLILHPRRSTVVYASPGGPPIAVVPPTQLDQPTWLPVVERRPAWMRVLLPSRPNGSTGWIHTGDGAAKIGHTPYEVRIDLSDRRLVLRKNGRPAGSWRVGIGTRRTPTPVGRTFLLAALAPSGVDYSPVILPLGMHSEKLRTYDGGPGTIGLHGWPDGSVFGQAISHGCVRLPAAALDAVRHIPLGSMIFIQA